MIVPFLIICIVISFAIYFLYLKPKKQVLKFASIARNAGYKVKVIPYNPLNFFVLNYMKKDNRSLKIYKEQLSQYDIVVGNLLTTLAILPIHPNILKDVFNQSSKVNKNPFFAKVYKLLTHNSGIGIGLAEGQEWKRKRKIISSVFHFEFLNHMIPSIEMVTEKQFQKIDQKIQKGQNVDILVSSINILSSLIVKIFFGTEIHEEIEGKPFCQFFMQFVNEICQYSQSFERMVFGLNCYNFGLTKRARNLKKQIKVVYAIAESITKQQLIKLKNKQFTDKNILTTLYENGMLNQTGDLNSDKYSIDQLIGQFFGFFAAGTDTTANTVNLLLHYLSQNNKYIDKIKEELKDIKSNYNLGDSQKLKKMK